MINKENGDIESKTGKFSACHYPSYDPSILVGRQRSKTIPFILRLYHLNHLWQSLLAEYPLALHLKYLQD
jgi:hypothetical protein